MAGDLPPDIPELIQQIDPKTLKRLDLPRTGVQQQGLDFLLLQKLLSLVYITNDLNSIPRIIDRRAPVNVGAAPGQQFTAPIDARRLIFSLRVGYVTTTTVGTRNVNIDLRVKAGSAFYRFMDDNPVASTTRTYQLGPGADPTSVSLAVDLNFPQMIEPEQSLAIEDLAHIDNTDQVDWWIQYVEIPI